MSVRILPVIVILFIWFAAPFALGLEVHVPGDYPDIQAAAAANGALPDTIILADGVHSGPGNSGIEFTLLTLRSASGDPEACVIDPGGDVFGWLYSYPYSADWSEIEGVGFRNSGGLRVYASRVHFENCRFTDCEVGACHWQLGIDGWARYRVIDCVARNCRGVVSGAYSIVIAGCDVSGNDGTVFSAWEIDCRSSRFVGNGSSLSWTEMIATFATDAPPFPGDGVYVDCEFRDNRYGSILGIRVSLVSGCTFAYNQGNCVSAYAYSPDASLSLLVENSTFAANGGREDQFDINADSGDSNAVVEIVNSLFAFRNAGGVYDSWSGIVPDVVSCCDVFGNDGGDWSGPLAPFQGQAGNLSEDPLFCGLYAGEYTLYGISPCLPENNDCASLIGAWGQGCENPTGIETSPGFSGRLEQNRPNPFNPRTEIAFTLEVSARVSLEIFDAAGRLCRTLMTDRSCTAGRHSLSWDGRDDSGAELSSGVYFYKLEAGGVGESRKMIMLR